MASRGLNKLEAAGDTFRREGRRRNPLVLLGAIATAGALVVGLSAFHVGDCRLSQKMMRNRVGFQAATVALMAGSAYLQGKT
ncbi:unnamed protein product [Sphagnum troendelagicum]|uniref:HIG1 domain-containing protein n=2 Tax=Sphagnum TaxID=13804 RepID=A0ABP0TJ44_9BRYO|nr:hypothetical protein CY35_11G117100 [Sphagnum magellanicum]